MSKWAQYAEQTPAAPAPARPAGNKWSQFEAPPEERAPGWFEPGSKSEALLRGASQGATLGFGDEIQALVRGLTTGRGYTAVRDEERAANAAAAKANPGAYIAGNVVGVAPSALAPVGVAKSVLAKSGSVTPARQVLQNIPKSGIGTIAAKSGAIGAAHGLGSAEGSLGDQATNAAIGGAIGAVAPAVILKAARPVREAGATVAGTNLTNANKARAVLSVEERRRRDATAGAIIGGIGSASAGQGFTSGAIAGGLAGYSGLPQSAAARRAGGAVRAVANAGRPIAGSTTAAALALQNLSGQTAREVVNQAGADVRAAVEQGQPVYAATFAALQKPEVRVAAAKVEEEDLMSDEE